MDIFIYNCNNNSDEYRKSVEEMIIKKISTDSIIKLNIESSTIRKLYHRFAEINNLFHVSYCDKTRDFETKYSYWCDKCEKYIKQKDYTIQYCCGDGQCGEFTVLCDLCESDDDVTIIGDEDGAYDDVPMKETKKTNNIIAISNNIELLKDIFEKKNIKKPMEWMKKREKKFL